MFVMAYSGIEVRLAHLSTFAVTKWYLADTSMFSFLFSVKVVGNVHSLLVDSAYFMAQNSGKQTCAVLARYMRGKRKGVHLITCMFVAYFFFGGRGVRAKM